MGIPCVVCRQLFSHVSRSTLSKGLAVDAEAHNQDAASTVGKAEVDAVLACLRDLSGREMCDEVSVNFAFVSSKAARKRMVGS